MMSILEQMEMFFDMAENNAHITTPVIDEAKIVAKPITNLNRLGDALKKSRLPKKVVDAIINTFSVTDMRRITVLQQFDELKKIDGIGEKRAALIVELLTGRFPNPLDMTRWSNKISEREESVGFGLRALDPDVLMREYEAYIMQLNDLKKQLYKDGEIDMNVVTKGRSVFEALWNLVYESDSKRIPFHAKEKECKTNRMSRSIGSDIFRINYESKKPTDEWITVGHGIQEMFNISPWFCGANMKNGQKRLDDFQKMVEHRLGNAGLILTTRDAYTTSTLAELYNPITMPIDLRKAHRANDAAVLEAYGFPKDASESEIVARLFKMYQELTKK
jgi:hypothetical protein